MKLTARRMVTLRAVHCNEINGLAYWPTGSVWQDTREAELCVTQAGSGYRLGLPFGLEHIEARSKDPRYINKPSA